MNDEEKQIVIHIRALSDEELLKILEDDPQKYSPLVWQFVNDEFDLRGNKELIEKLNKNLEREEIKATTYEKKNKRAYTIFTIIMATGPLLLVAVWLYWQIRQLDLYTALLIAASILSTAGYLAVRRL
jgi:hypothetical protein